MKQILRFENIFCVLLLPVLYFLFSKMATFFCSAWNISVSKVIMLIAFGIVELIAIIFRKKIEAYLKKDKLMLIALFFSAILGVLLRPVFLRGCGEKSNIISFIGAVLLFCIFLSLLLRNLIYVIRRVKTIRLTKKDIVFLIASFVILNLEAFVYCKFMKQIFVWDNAGYFTMVHKLNDAFPGIEYFKSVYNSVFETDYNYIIMLPASLMCKLFGKSRLVFVLSIINFYLYPLVALVCFCGKRFFKLGTKKVCFVILSLPYLVFAANTGFIDIGGILPVFLAVILYFYCDRDKTSVLAGVLLAIAVYMRRWYSFFALSFVLTIFIHSVREKSFKSFFEVLGAFSFMLLFFAQDFVSTRLLADYKNMYSAYALGIKTDIMIFTRYFGVIMTAVLCLYVFFHKKIKAERYILLQAVLNFSLFVSVQTHGQQHLALYIPAFIILMMSVASKIKSKQGIAVLALLSAFQTANTFIPRIQPTSIGEIKKAALIPDFSIYPKVDKNADAILQITEYMDREFGMNEKTVCLLASSLMLNYDTLNNAEASLSVSRKYDVERGKYFLPISEVDNRDGLADTLFVADYLLVPSKLQIHLAEDEQEVVAVPYQKIISNQDFGTAYEKQEVEFTLSDKTKVYVYKRIRDVEAAEIEKIYNEIFN